MSPRRSLTRNVEPSRMLIVSLATGCSFVLDEEDARWGAVGPDELQRRAHEPVDALSRLDPVDDDAVADEDVERQPLRGGGSLDEVDGRVDVRAGVDAE